MQHDTYGEIYAASVALFRRHPTVRHRAFRSRVAAGQYWLLYELVERYIPDTAHVLDWGAGNGHFSFLLHRRGNRVTAYSLAACPVAESLAAENPEGFAFVRGDDPEVLPFEDGTFGAVASIGVLEHVRESGGNEPASLREIRRVLAPGGVFLCYHFPNRWSWIEAVLRLRGGHYHHTFRYTGDDIRRLLADAGLELVELRRYGALPRNVLTRLPRRLAESLWLARAVDVTDRVLTRIVGPIAQSFAFVAANPGIVNTSASGGAVRPDHNRPPDWNPGADRPDHNRAPD
jgi:SAM-dependent methyltransferase